MSAAGLRDVGSRLERISSVTRKCPPVLTGESNRETFSYRDVQDTEKRALLYDGLQSSE